MLKSFFRNDLNFREDIDVSIAHRLGQSSSSAKPIIVKFTRLRDRKTVWAKRFSLAAPELKVREHFPINVQKARSELFP